MIIYIAGPITGVKDYKKKFKRAEEHLRLRENADVINPTKLNPENKYFDYADYMINSLRLLKKADAIYVLTGSVNSVGATFEVQVAKQLGLQIRYENPDEYGRKTK